MCHFFCGCDCFAVRVALRKEDLRRGWRQQWVGDGGDSRRCSVWWAQRRRQWGAGWRSVWWCDAQLQLQRVSDERRVTSWLSGFDWAVQQLLFSVAPCWEGDSQHQQQRPIQLAVCAPTPVETLPSPQPVPCSPFCERDSEPTASYWSSPLVAAVRW